MKRLRRETNDVWSDSLERRIEQLERRVVPPGAKYAYLDGPLNFSQEIGAGSTENIGWHSFTTNDNKLFGTLTSGSSLPFDNQQGDTTLKMATDDWVIAAYMAMHWEDDATGYVHSGAIEVGNCQLQVGSFFSVPLAMQWAELKPTSGDNRQYGVSDALLCTSVPFLDGGPGPFFVVRASNGDGSPRDVTYCGLMVYAWSPYGDGDQDPRIFP